MCIDAGDSKTQGKHSFGVTMVRQPPRHSLVGELMSSDDLLVRKRDGELVSTPVPQLRKGTIVLLGPEHRPCHIVEMTTAKMLSPTSGRKADGSADYYCDAPRCGRYIMPYEVRYACLDCREDFDLCEACESESDHERTTGHTLAKIRVNQNTVDVTKYKRLLYFYRKYNSIKDLRSAAAEDMVLLNLRT